MKPIQNYSTKIKQNELFNLSKFVVTENFNHHTDEEFSNSYKNDIIAMYKEEEAYLENSQFFVIKNNNEEMIGTIRVLKWDYIYPLPIQKLFGINPLIYNKDSSINEIWHIGRFAIKKGIRDISLLKKLMVFAIRPICTHKDNKAYAECDAKLLHIIKLLGIKTKIIGKPISYLGSKTIPISMSYNGLINFYKKNEYLVK